MMMDQYKREIDEPSSQQQVASPHLILDESPSEESMAELIEKSAALRWS